MGFKSKKFRIVDKKTAIEFLRNTNGIEIDSIIIQNKK